MGWKTDTIRVGPATIRRASESSSSRNGGGSGWGPVPGAWGLVLTARQRNNAAAGLFVGTEEADVAATQGEKPSAASGEAKPRTPTARGDAKERGPQPAPPADRPEAEADGKKRGGVRSWIRRSQVRDHCDRACGPGVDRRRCRLVAERTPLRGHGRRLHRCAPERDQRPGRRGDHRRSGDRQRDRLARPDPGAARQS